MRARSTTALAAPLARDGERGSMLIEVLVSGLLLAILAVGLFGAFDGSARVSARSKERATAARLAEEDQERLRGLPITKISNLRETLPPKPIDGVNYLVSSRTDWVADTSGNTSCAAGDAKADYLKIRTTVTADKPGAAKPVVVDSMLTPPVGTYGDGQGSLALEILDRDGKGVAGLPVTITGPVTDDDATNADGCAFFGYEPVGGYTISFSGVNYVNWQGVTSVTETTSIEGGKVSTKSLPYDRAGSAAVSFVNSADETVSYDSVQLAHSKVTRAHKAASAAASVTVPNLFPFFSDPYNAYAGECSANNPVLYPTASPTKNPVIPAPVDRGTTVPVTVRLPTLTLRVVQKGVAGSPAYGSPVRVRITSPCGGAPKGYTTDASSVARDAANATLPALPYGDFSVCVDNAVTGPGLRSETVVVQNHLPAGKAQDVPLEPPGPGVTEAACA